jgi:hypothetical protein
MRAQRNLMAIGSDFKMTHIGAEDKPVAVNL